MDLTLDLNKNSAKPVDTDIASQESTVRNPGRPRARGGGPSHANAGAFRERLDRMLTGSPEEPKHLLNCKRFLSQPLPTDRHLDDAISVVRRVRTL